eukprot:3748844-Pyramimonas_sp.AAC.1
MTGVERSGYMDNHLSQIMAESYAKEDKLSGVGLGLRVVFYHALCSRPRMTIEKKVYGRAL